ncbi:hypothetical protein, partial [Streptomyces sp. NPDC056670]|uniref:hypothetical protein n=1 Tax=Streptomyces sp. NPDC056670 TaxID=3345904 RepID=UPI003673B30A
FNGRDAIKDALEEALDLATYLMQVRLEKEATQARIAEALHHHRADQNGMCVSCVTPVPCGTRRALLGIA